MNQKNDIDGRTGAARPDVASEIRVIPAWAWMLAALVYLLVQWVFHSLAWPHERNPPVLAFQIAFPLFIGLLPALLVLGVGYVNRDAGRRGMSRTLWTLVVVFVPNAIGFVVYFFARQPIQRVCPQCGRPVSTRANFCPNCAHAFRPTCPQCKAALDPGDRFCPNCGHGIAA